MHAIFTAAKHRPARLEGSATVGVRSAWKISDRHEKMNPDFLCSLQLFECKSYSGRTVFFKNKKEVKPRSDNGIIELTVFGTFYCTAMLLPPYLCTSLCQTTPLHTGTHTRIPSPSAFASN